MRQLLIVKGSGELGNESSINNGIDNTFNLYGLANGCIAFFVPGESSLVTSAPTKNFAIALGRPNGQHPFIIPEVDIKSLHIIKTLPKKGANCVATITLGTTEVGKEYTLRFFKKGVVPHERNSWTASIVAKTNNSGYTESEALKNAILSKVNDKFPFMVERSNGLLTITCTNVGEDWEIVGMDGLSGTDISVNHAKPNIGDKAYIQKLASFCAAGKGFYHTNGEGRDVIPGYPEYVADFTLNTSGNNDTSTEGYAVYTLRFKVGRDASKTRDEQVWQNVYIAVPVGSSSGIKGGLSGNVIKALDAILPEGDYYHNLINTAIEAAAGDEGDEEGDGTGPGETTDGDNK